MKYSSGAHRALTRSYGRYTIYQQVSNCFTQQIFTLFLLTTDLTLIGLRNGENTENATILFPLQHINETRLVIYKCVCSQGRLISAISITGR